VSYVTYTAKRRLKSGHSVSTAYSIEFDSLLLQPGFNGDSVAKRSIGGSTETVFKRFDETWDFTASNQAESLFNDWVEFFASVAGGESFTLDAYGSIATPDNVQTVIMVGQPSIPRIGTSQAYHASFNARVIS